MSATTYPRQASSPRVTGSNIVLGLLSLVATVGVAAGIWRLILGMGSTTALSDVYPWGIWIGFDFTLIAFSASAFTMATVVYILRLKTYRPAMLPAVMAGLLGYVAVLLLLVLDLGRWDRFYHFMLFWNVHSPLFEICWCILLYTGVLFIENSTHVFEWLHWEKPAHFIHRLVIPVSVLGLTLSSLHQSTLGTMYLNMPHRLHPLWYSPIVSPLFFISSVMAGLSLATIAYAVAAQVRGEVAKPEILNGLAKGIAGVTLVYVLLKLGDIYLAGELPLLLAFDQMSRLMWVELGLCAIVPMVLFLIPALRANRWIRWAGVSLVLFGVLLNRFDMTLFAQQLNSNEIYSPHILEWLSTAGIIAGAILTWYLAIRYLIKPDKAVSVEVHH